jgi:hypothetical protein
LTMSWQKKEWWIRCDDYLITQMSEISIMCRAVYWLDRKNSVYPSLQCLPSAGLPNFFGTWYQKCTKWTQNVPSGHNISQMSIKYSRWP